MKKKNTYMLLIIFVFMLFVAGSCEKEDEESQPPPIRQTGEETLGCLIDGGGNNYTIVLEKCKDSIVEKVSTLNGNPEESCSNGGIYFKKYSSQTATFKTSDSENGKVLISHFDTINRIISGTFYFDAVNSEGEITQIRDGRFDVKIMN